MLEARYSPSLARAVRRLALEAGLPYAPHPDRVPNSRRALELAEWARDLGPARHAQLHERLMDAYWAEGRDISSWDELEACLGDVGLDAAAGRAAVESGEHAPAVDAATAWAHEQGIVAVPAFVLDGRLLVSGAQPHETFERAVERVRDLRRRDAEGGAEARRAGG